MADIRSDARTRGIAAGWIKESIQLPIVVSDMMNTVSKKEGHGSKKVVSTAAIALYIGMPESLRRMMYDYVVVRARNPQSIDPKELWEKLASIFAEDQDIGHYLSRILDPELTPKPGKKKSDRKGSRPRRSA